MEALEKRLNERVGDASDATVEVLRQQLAEERGSISWMRFDSSGPPENMAAAIAAAIH
jgi:predicted kinase